MHEKERKTLHLLAEKEAGKKAWHGTRKLLIIMSISVISVSPNNSITFFSYPYPNISLIYNGGVYMVLSKILLLLSATMPVPACMEEVGGGWWSGRRNMPP